MARRAYRLNLISPLHVGEMGVGQEETLDYIPSDTLFGALAVTWREMGRTDLLDALPGWADTGAALLLTSAFPYLGDTLFYPRPRLLVQPANGGKAYKKVRWISASVLHKLLAEPTQQQVSKLWSPEHLPAGQVWMDADEVTSRPAKGEQLWEAVRVPKVAVDRSSSASALFHVGRVHFHKQAGLWFAVAGEDAWLDAVEEALHLLADSGIGGQRSRGNGRFSLQRLPDAVAPETATHASGYQLLLSRLAPTSEQMGALRAAQSSYQTVTVGGWAGTPGENPLIRKRVRMLEEGSIVAAGPLGRLVDVNPDWNIVKHPIYRYGYGYGVTIHLPDDKRQPLEGGRG